MASEEPLYCTCRKPYDETQFMIECDVCNDWFHGSCVGVQEHQAADIEIYHCPKCEETHGPLVLKKRRNWHRHDYSEEEDGKAVQTGTIVFIKELKNRTFPSGDEIIKRMNGSDITKEYFHQHGFTVPILVEKKEGLGMILPPPSFSVEDVEKKVGSLYEIDVIDVARQEDHKMLMRNWTEYFNSPDRQKILNVISLEFSKTKLSEIVDPPSVVRQVSWVSTLWPDDLPEEAEVARPEVQKYCLMGVKDSFTDFHIDFGGTSVWYHVLWGEKVFYLIKPTPSNMSLFESWLSSATQSETFFGDQVDRCWRCVVKQGQTLFIPTAWIHAVFTPIDSLVFGGNFLHNYNIPLQLEAYEIERRVKTPEKYLFPSYETVNWYAAKHVLDVLRECAEDRRKPESFYVNGAIALVQHLKKWTRRKDYFKRGEAHLEGIQYSKIIRSLTAELKHLETQTSNTSPKKTERKTEKKKERCVSAKMASIDLLHKHTEEKLKALQQQSSSIYNFEDEDEVTTPGVLKVRIPKAGALVTKSQDGSAISLSRAESVDAKLKVPPQKRAPGGKKKDGAIPEKDYKAPAKYVILPYPLRTLILSCSPPGMQQQIGSMKEEGLMSSTLTVKANGEEEDESDKDTLVVDENPPPRQAIKKNSASKPGSLRLKLSIANKNRSQGGGAEDGQGENLSEDETAHRLNIPTIRGGLNGSIADILEASGYGTETDFKVDEESVTSSPTMRDAIQGMLTMSRGGRSGSSLFVLGEKSSLEQQTAKRVGGAVELEEEEEQRLMSGYYQDSEYVYPSFELEEDEMLSRKKHDKDDNWNPKARVDVPERREERSQRDGVKNQAVASGLAATAAKLAEMPIPGVKTSKKHGKTKSVEKEFEIKPLPGPSSDLASSTSAFRPGIKRADVSPTHQQQKGGLLFQ
ncbi:hypothetical protein C0Q70_15320 [Pomacea canaliculata]|uniref:Uncharacterized protein n=1 Tax=Pomacea canaliculata TaxID=400727 RepID=A0A2T7NUK4_POMCA|nr:hypothetical protein C0Q70_15320 [Pomacea canaliculata]